MLEFEKKVMLSPEEYGYLMKNLGTESKNVTHLNYYYDTDDFELNRQGITCRIREKNGVCTATVKEHRLNGSDCSVENSRTVKDRYDDSLFQNMGIRYHGCMETLRCTLLPFPGISIMLDRNSYLGTVDYELEVEYDRGKEELAIAEFDRIASQLVQNGILTSAGDFRKRIGQGKSKSERFFKRRAKVERRLP